MILDTKLFLKYLFFSFLDRLNWILTKTERNGDTVLFLRLDAIGDYVLFRNFIEIVRSDPKYRSRRMVFVGNERCKELALGLDGSFFDECIWINPSRFALNPVYRWKKMSQLIKKEYVEVINPVFSREVLVQDMIVAKVKARRKIGHSPNRSNIKNWQFRISEKKYTDLLGDPGGVLFEFLRNKHFFELLLERSIALKKPEIRLPEVELEITLPVHYAVLFLGATHTRRQWPPEKFAEIAEFLVQRYGLSIVICGGPGDRELAGRFKNESSQNYTDLVGKTSLMELLVVIKQSKLILSNETSAPHLAVSLNVPYIFVVSNGNHYGRFTPYPQSMDANYFAIYHPEFIEQYKNDYSLYSESEFVSDLKTADIEVDEVRETIQSHLSVNASES